MIYSFSTAHFAIKKMCLMLRLPINKSDIVSAKFIRIVSFSKIPDQPEKPQNLRPIDTNRDYIVLQWEAPQRDGGSPITGYVIEKRDAKRREYFYLAELPADKLTYKAVRLFEGNEYYFRVIAENEVGPSEPCELQQPVKAKLPYGQCLFV